MESKFDTDMPYEAPRPRELSESELADKRRLLRDVGGLSADQVSNLEALRERVMKGLCNDSTPEYSRLAFIKELFKTRVIRDD